MKKRLSMLFLASANLLSALIPNGEQVRSYGWWQDTVLNATRLPLDKEDILHLLFKN